MKASFAWGAAVLALGALLHASSQGLQGVRLELPEMRLQPGGIWERWEFDVEQTEGPLERVVLDLDVWLESREFACENLYDDPTLPLTQPVYGYVYATVPWEIEVDGEVVWIETTILNQQTPNVDFVFDGVNDHDGPSGTATLTEARKDSWPLVRFLHDVDAFQGAGTVRVAVTAPSGGITGGMTTPSADTHLAIWGGGELRLWYEFGEAT